MTSFRGRQPHKSKHEPQTKEEPAHCSNLRLQNVCDAEGPEKKHLATAGARYVTVGTRRERKPVA